jgi:molybdopterin-guanine dinucleotide biosynthesis protein A
VDGRPLIDTVLAAVQAADPIVVVGPDTLARPGVVLAQEDPPFGGPAAGLVAGLAALAKAAPRATDTAATSTSATDTARMAGADPVPDPGARRARQPGPEWVWLLACDLPRASEVVALIAASVAAAPLGLAEDGVILVDTAERDQWLAGRYRRSSLERAGAAVSSQQNAPLRAIVGSLNLRRIMDESGVAVDLDTWDDVDRYRARPAHPHLEREGAADERREDTR